jgi:hypothetical protein
LSPPKKPKNGSHVARRFAEFETYLPREGQLEGASPKRKPQASSKGWTSIDQAQVEKLKDRLGATEIAKRLKIGRASVYRFVTTDRSAVTICFDDEDSGAECRWGAPKYDCITEEPVRDKITMLGREDCRCGDSWRQKDEGSLQCLKLAARFLLR